MNEHTSIKERLLLLEANVSEMQVRLQRQAKTITNRDVEIAKLKEEIESKRSTISEMIFAEFKLRLELDQLKEKLKAEVEHNFASAANQCVNDAIIGDDCGYSCCTVYQRLKKSEEELDSMKRKEKEEFLRTNKAEKECYKIKKMLNDLFNLINQKDNHGG